jgi:hypothetical protein
MITENILGKRIVDPGVDVDVVVLSQDQEERYIRNSGSQGIRAVESQKRATRSVLGHLDDSFRKIRHQEQYSYDRGALKLLIFRFCGVESLQWGGQAST